MELIGGYGIPYDPEPDLQRLTSDRENALNELWENLYHQGDVGTASYAAVPSLVEAGELLLVSAIEVARKAPHNPSIPENLEKPYTAALKLALQNVPEDEEQLRGYYSIHASLQNKNQLAKALQLLSIAEILNEYG